MAERFGGRFSPTPQGTDASPPPHEAPPSRAERRTAWLFAVAVPFALKAFFQDPAGLARYLAAFGLLVGAAWLTREGVRAAETYAARRSARRPAFPRKIAGSLLTGLGLGIAGFAAAAGDILAPAAYAGVGAILHFLAFGPDPMRDKGAEGIDTFQTDRVARAIDEAEKHLAAMTDAMLRAGDRQLMARLEQFQTTARDLFRTVENDPRDLTAARKYLSVYLLGARDATVKFTEIWSRNRDPQARADYEALLTDLEQNFAARTEKLLLDDRSDLTVEIDVLRERLDREGVHPKE